LEVAEGRWNKSHEADMDVGLAFGFLVTRVDVPSEALVIYPKAQGRQLRRGGTGRSKRGEAVQPLLAWCGMEFHDFLQTKFGNGLNKP